MSTLRSSAERDDGTGGRGATVPGQDGTLTGRDGESDFQPLPDLDPEVVAADDLLLGALGRAEPVAGDDPLAGLLTAWRADLDADPPAADLGIDLDSARDPATPHRVGAGPDGIRPSRSRSTVRRPRPAVPTRRPGPHASASRSPAGRRPGAAGSAPESTARPAPSRPAARPGPLVRRLALSSVVGVVLTALLGLGVNHAGPTSPLWPVAAAVYPDRSAVRAAEHTIQLAREAVAEQRYSDARTELDRAAVQVTEVRDPAEAGRLRTEIERIRAGLPGAAQRSEAPTGAGPTPVRPSPATPGRTPGPAGTPGDAVPPAVRSGPAQPPPASPSRQEILPLPIPLLPSLLPSGLPLLPSGGCVLLCPPD